MGPAGPVSGIWVKFSGRVLSAWYQSFRFPILSDCSPHELIWLLVSYIDGPTAADPSFGILVVKKGIVVTIIRVFLCEFNLNCLSGTQPFAMDGDMGAGPFDQGLGPDHPAAERSGQSNAPEDRSDANVIERVFRQFSGLL